MPSIAETYVTIIPETSKIADGVRRVFRELDASAREAGQRWGREIQQGLGDAKVKVSADTAKARAEIDAAAKDRHSTVHVDVDKDRLGSSMSTAVEDAGAKSAGAAASAGSSIGTSMGGALTPVLMGAGITALAGIASAASGIIGPAMAGLAGGATMFGTLALGLDGVKDAYTAVTKAAQDSGTDQKAQAEAVASASRTLRDAVQSEAQAQQDVANARKDARQQLDDLNLSLRGGQISETDAILAAQKARQDLRTGTYQTALDYEIAQQRVVDADQRVLEAHNRVNNLQSKANDANAKGVDNADNVRAANERLVRSQESVTQAQVGLHDAQIKVSSSAKDAVNAMAQLSPNAQAFVNTLVGLKPAFQDFKNSVQDGLFAGIGPQIQQLAGTYFPLLKTALTQMAGLMNQAFSGIAKLLESPQMLSSISTIFNNINASFQAFMPAISPLIQAFVKLTEVGSGFLPQLAQMAVQAADAFNQFAQSGQLKEWMSTGMQTLQQLGGILQQLLPIFNQLAPIGTAALSGIQTILASLAPSIGPLSKAFASLMTAITPALGLIGQLVSTVITAVAPALTKWFNAMGPVIQAIAGALGPVLQQLQPILGQVATTLAQAMVQGIKTLLPVLIPFVEQAGKLLVAVLPLVPPLIQLALSALPSVQGAIAAILPIMTKWLTKLTDLANVIIPPLVKAVEFLATTFGKQFDHIKTVVGGVWDFVKPIFEQMKSYLEYLSPALQLIGLIPASGGSASGSGYLPKTGSPAVPGSPGSPMAPASSPSAQATVDEVNRRLAASGVGPNAFPAPGAGSGALPDTASTAASRAPNAQIDPNSNIIDFLKSVGGQQGLQDIADKTQAHGGTHPNDPGEHSVNRAVDLSGSPAQMAAFVNWWNSDPSRVAATRQLIYAGGGADLTKEIFGGKFVGNQSSIYAGDNPGHTEHVHIALEGVPLGGATVSSTGPASVAYPTTMPPVNASQYAAPSATPSAALTPQSGQQQVAAQIIAEGQRRGLTQDQIIAVLSTGLQESGLSPTASGGGGAWHGIFQQDSSYPGRDDPNQNISAFYDRLKLQPGQDPWSPIFALQQGTPYNSPGARTGYMSEIQSKMGQANQLYNSAGSGTPTPAGTPNDPMYMALSPNIPAGQQKGPGDAKSMEQLGQQLGPDALQIFGLDGSVFKDPTSFGIMKLFSGLINGLTGIKTGGGGGGGYGGGGGGGGFGSLLGLIPQGFGNLQVGSPQNAPGQFMPLQPGSGGGSLLDAVQFKPPGGQGSPGPGNVDNSINFNGPVNGNPQPAFSAANDANIPRMRQGLNSLP